MKTNFKDKIYDHEEIPPLGTWDRIAAELDSQERIVHIDTPVRKKSVFAKLAVAASIIILLTAAVFYLTNKKTTEEQIQPTSLSKNSPVDPDNRYIIVTSPSGQKIKISSKFSNYLGSLYQNNTENPDWYKKFSEWREIMQNRPLTPTTPNFLDVVEMSDFLEKAN